MSESTACKTNSATCREESLGRPGHTAARRVCRPSSHFSPFHHVFDEPFYYHRSVTSGRQAMHGAGVL